ncbi:hypothetical protein V8B97DRAFT_794587 [Scleroderma yunnanense]
MSLPLLSHFFGTGLKVTMAIVEGVAVRLVRGPHLSFVHIAVVLKSRNTERLFFSPTDNAYRITQILGYCAFLDAVDPPNEGRCTTFVLPLGGSQECI